MITLVPIFLLIAFIYSVVGLGGGSSYLAVLAWKGMPREALVVTALLCNLIVSAQGTVSYAAAGFFRPRIFWPLVFSSVPFAFLGGLLSVSDEIFYLLLGISLLMAALRMFFPKALLQKKAVPEKMFWILGPITGALLGYLAGVVGLGGGIFLGPVLILSGVATAKETAAITAPFIFVNSLAGLAAHYSHINFPLMTFSAPLLLAVAVGGWGGSRLGSRHFKPIWVQRVAAVLLSVVGFKLLGRIGI